MPAVILDHGGPSDRQSLCLVTARGTRIKNVRGSEWEPLRLRRAAQRHGRCHPGAKLRSISARYNCVGMVFASRRTTVDIDQLRLILDDDGYRPLSEEADVCPGDVAVYRGHTEIKHVGLVVSVKPELEPRTEDQSVTVLSKWGAFGEYIHLVDDVPPECGTLAGYWTERKTI